jgi:hypothetical protein
MGLRRLPRIEVIEAIDDVNQSATFRANEGVIKTEYKNFIIIVQATPRGEGSCLVHWSFEYEKLKDNIPDPRTLLDRVLHPLQQRH